MKNESLKCPFCEGDLRWDSDSNASESSCEYSENDTAVVSFYTCSRCGREYEIYEPREEDRNGEYKDYWNPKT